MWGAGAFTGHPMSVSAELAPTSSRPKRSSPHGARPPFRMRATPSREMLKPLARISSRIASRSTTALTFDADDVQGELAERM
jgi:hypothetical protein